MTRSTRWVRIQVDRDLHTTLRQQALRRGLTWDELFIEAGHLWLIAPVMRPSTETAVPPESASPH